MPVPSFGQEQQQQQNPTLAQTLPSSIPLLGIIIRPSSSICSPLGLHAAAVLAIFEYNSGG
jgi:hypothetical protein